MVSARADVTVCGELSESLTVTLNENVPLAVGMPLIVPLVDRVNPAARNQREDSTGRAWLLLWPARSPSKCCPPRHSQEQRWLVAGLRVEQWLVQG